MNILKVCQNRFNSFGYYYDLVDETNGNILSSLEIDKELISTCRREKISFPIDGDIYYLCNFFTAHSYRRRGYGRELLNLVKEEFRGKFVYLIVSSANEKVTDKQLVEFYLSLGFKIHTQKDKYKELTWMVLDNR